jgi:hypothetical protein
MSSCVGSLSLAYEDMKPAGDLLPEGVQSAVDAGEMPVSLVAPRSTFDGMPARQAHRIGQVLTEDEGSSFWRGLDLLWQSMSEPDAIALTLGGLLCTNQVLGRKTD